MKFWLFAASKLSKWRGRKQTCWGECFELGSDWARQILAEFYLSQHRYFELNSQQFSEKHILFIKELSQ